MANNNQFLALEAVWEHHRANVEQLAEISGSCIFVCGIRQGIYYFLSSNIANFGYEIPEGNSSADPYFLEHRIHPDDLPVFQRTMDRLYFDFIDSLPPEEQKDYKHIFEFRALDKNGEWVRVISQHQILDSGSEGCSLLLGTVDLSPDQTPDVGLRFTLMNFKTGEIVPFSVREHSETALTKREIEILELVNAGMYSKEISERLSISIHTVNRHRQNILEKTNTNNALEAINHARKLGLLS